MLLRGETQIKKSGIAGSSGRGGGGMRVFKNQVR